MKKRTWLALGVALLALHGRALGQDDGVVEAVGLSADDTFYDVIGTSDGCAVAVGYTTYGSQGKDVLLVKFDDCGDFVWTKRLGGTGDEEGRSVIELPGGDFVATGHTSSVGGPGDHLLLSRFTASGVEVWTTVLTDSSGGYELRGYDVIRDSSGDLVVTGTVWNDALEYSVLMAKFAAADGSLVRASGFRRPLTPLYEYWGESLVEACDGDYIVVGGLLAPGDDRRVLLARIKSGLLLAEWGRWIQEDDDDSVGHSITLANDGALVLTGDTAGHLFVSKRNCTGSAVPYWQKKLAADSVGHSIIQTSGDHDLVVAGGLGTHFLAGSWATNGSARWIRGWAEGVAYGVAEDIEQRLWIAGATSDWGAGGEDGVIAKLDPDGHTCLQQQYVPLSPGDWNPAEDDHALTWHALPVDEWPWAVDTHDISVQDDFLCDDECPEECCFDDGSCVELTPDDCSVQGGEAQGPGTTCQPTGGCCLPDLSCVTTTETCCNLAGGAWQGAGTACTEAEACCLPDHTCIMVDPLCCDDLGGTALGPGSECLGMWACCSNGGATCIDADLACCEAMGGVAGYVAQCLNDNDSNGINDACEQACCFSSGLCANLPVDDCASQGGTAQGAGTACTEPQGCCLADGTCVDIDPLCCDDLGGMAQGLETVCTEEEACCFDDGSCQNADPLCCDELEGWSPGNGLPCLGDANGNDIDDACDQPPIPTVSEWGLIVLGLLVVTAGVVIMRRRRSSFMSS
ncbi:MAG TPA: IPTL-CTERM sorting domain-containing protein [Phycisphaerae bacterium]|nr:IPTL-CTERM sorting domain-containing protein [Phycisphaerae bacterium]